MPAAPAAGSVWPSPLLTAPRHSGACLGLAWPLPNTAARAPTSMGSPRGVPVPCISRQATDLAASWASSSAMQITCNRDHAAEDLLRLLQEYLGSLELCGH